MIVSSIQAEIKALSDRSELIQVYNSLRAEVARTREDMRNSEVSIVKAIVVSLALPTQICTKCT